jgi:hypothetical protein
MNRVDADASARHSLAVFRGCDPPVSLITGKVCRDANHEVAEDVCWRRLEQA